MAEKEPIKSFRRGVDPLGNNSKPFNNPNAFIDQILIYHGAKPTEANRQSLRSKIEGMQKHLN